MFQLGVLKSQQKFTLKCEFKNDKQMGVAQKEEGPILTQLLENCLRCFGSSCINCTNDFGNL
jgi:hypothetical protein